MYALCIVWVMLCIYLLFRFQCTFLKILVLDVEVRSVERVVFYEGAANGNVFALSIENVASASAASSIDTLRNERLFGSIVVS